MRTVVGVFPSRDEADAVLHDLNAIGIPPDEVAIGEPGATDHEKEWSRRNISAAAASAWGWIFALMIPEISERNLAGATVFGAEVGAAGGMLAGAVFSAIRAASTGGPSHPVISAVTGLVIGGFAGALAAAYYNMGVSHERLALCTEAEQEHGFVVAAHVIEAREPDALRIMNDHGAKKARGDADAWLASGWTGAHPAEEPYPSDSEHRAHPI